MQKKRTRLITKDSWYRGGGSAVPCNGGEPRVTYVQANSIAPSKGALYLAGGIPLCYQRCGTRFHQLEDELNKVGVYSHAGGDAVRKPELNRMVAKPTHGRRGFGGRAGFSWRLSPGS